MMLPVAQTRREIEAFLRLDLSLPSPLSSVCLYLAQLLGYSTVVSVHAISLDLKTSINFHNNSKLSCLA